MASILDYVKSNLGETYEKLVSVALYDGQPKPDVAEIRTLALLSRFGIEDADDLSEFGRSYMGDWVALSLIPLAIDYYMVQTRLVDNASRPQGVTPLGGEVGQNYNRVQALQDLAEQLRINLADGKTDFVDGLPNTANADYAVMMTSQHTRRLRTQDPYDSFDRVGGWGGPIYAGFGVGYIVVEESLAP